MTERPDENGSGSARTVLRPEARSNHVFDHNHGGLSNSSICYNCLQLAAPSQFDFAALAIRHCKVTPLRQELFQPIEIGAAFVNGNIIEITMISDQSVLKRFSA